MKPRTFVIFAVCFLAVRATHVQKRSDDGTLQALETDVSRLSNELTSLTAQMTAMQQEMRQEITSLQTKLTSRENQLSAQASKLENYAKVVAFYAWADASRVNAAAKGPIVLRHAQTNIGNAYNPQTGMFTAPVSGLYTFHASFMAVPTGNEHVAMLVDNGIVSFAYSDSGHGYFDQTGLHATVHVNAGQKVHINNWETGARTIYGGQHLTFSGFLVRAD